ncbi:MAG TPA: hypothetical protein VFI06_00185 [Chitinophagaceae bacterium]|nr:hypothetical protein [Chitinophagaceae bacterium]
MKNSEKKTLGTTELEDQACSEEKCVTCFENRGCIYEQYVAAMIHTIELSYGQNRIDSNVQISKRA